MENQRIEMNENTGEIVIVSGGSRIVISKEFQEEIYYIVAGRKAREVLSASATVKSATADPQVIEDLIPYYLSRQEDSNQKDAEDFCWLAIVDLDLEMQREENEEDEFEFEEETLPEGFVFDETILG